jgi:hypothetical protein
MARAYEIVEWANRIPHGPRYERGGNVSVRMLPAPVAARAWSACALPPPYVPYPAYEAKPTVGPPTSHVPLSSGTATAAIDFFRPDARSTSPGAGLATCSGSALDQSRVWDHILRALQIGAPHIPGVAHTGQWFRRPIVD